MRDTPLDTLDRSRVTFLKSLADSVGKFDAGADFYFSAISAERRGYVLGSQDLALLKMFNSVVRKADETQATASNAYDLDREAETSASMMTSTGISQEQMAYYMGHGAGMNIPDEPR